MRPLSVLAAGLLAAAFGGSAVPGSDTILCRKLEAPIQVVLRAVAGSPPGELRVAVEVRTQAVLTDMRMIVRLEDRAQATSRQEARGLWVPVGETLHEELTLRDAPGSGTLFVGVEGRHGNAVLHRTAALAIGNPSARGLAGLARGDAEGRTYFEVRSTGTAEAARGGVAAALAGSAFYEDKPYDRAGFTGKRVKLPIRYATVQLVADDDRSVLATSSTDGRGSYALTAATAGSRRVHVAVTAASRAPYAAQVVNSKRQIYALAGPSFSAGSPPGAGDLTAAQADLGGVFNMLDATIRGSDLALALSPGARFPSLRIFWEKDGSDGTFFDGRGIHVLGTRQDPDEYDDDVVLHEFGHYVANAFSRDTSEGGDHDPFDDEPEPRDLAWSEGFATWWSSEARGDPSYVDNSATGNLFFEIERPTPRDVTRGEGNEIAVGAILWDVSDPANEPHDRMDRKRTKLWEVTSSYFRERRPDSTLDAFCEGWISRGLGETSALSAIFKDRGASCP
jgi:hypothetical protein